jgi:hypothetical protein
VSIAGAGGRPRLGHHVGEDRSDLRAVLDREQVSPEHYSLDGGHDFERYVLAIREGGWAVYYSERGLETGLAVFDTEDEACSELLLRIISDPHTCIR